MSSKKIAILYSELAGYTLACLRALKQHHDVEILVFYWPPSDDAPFHFDKLEGIDHAYPKDQYRFKEIVEILNDFAPDIIKISGWMDKDYLKVARFFKKKGIPVVAGLDAPWAGSLKQVLFGKFAPFYLKHHIDTFWVTGERQAQFAKKFGFSGESLRYGLYCCDWDKFASAYYSNDHDHDQENAFLYVGRYISIKGIKLIIKAYNNYRAITENPWKLICAGTGELQKSIENTPGIENVGFIQPSDLPKLMKSCRAFVLPSFVEPWGVVIQEAAASGLPIICSDACGASVHLVQDGYNGYVFESGNLEHLTNCMIRMSNLSDEEYSDMSEAGFELSKQFKPERWAETIMNIITNTELRSNKYPISS
ncbi:MAG: glycosyltransferase family 4 protein [Balneolales bacterium]